MSEHEQLRCCTRCYQTKPVVGGFHAAAGCKPYPWCRDCRAEYNREWVRRRAPKTEHQLAQQRARGAEQRERHRERHLARMAANYAIRSGRLTRSACCELCGTDPGVNRLGRTLLRADHHRGYAREHWLDVRFICPTCDGLQIRAQNDARRAATSNPEAVASTEAA